MGMMVMAWHLGPGWLSGGHWVAHGGEGVAHGGESVALGSWLVLPRHRSTER